MILTRLFLLVMLVAVLAAFLGAGGPILLSALAIPAVIILLVKVLETLLRFYARPMSRVIEERPGAHRQKHHDSVEQEHGPSLDAMTKHLADGDIPHLGNDGEIYFSKSNKDGA